MYRTIGNAILEHFTSSFIESFKDNVLNEKVKPVMGSLLYCDLAFSLVEHSGIYIGNQQIVHLDGSGVVEIVSPDEFLGRLNGFNTAMSIYVSCKQEQPIGSRKAANKAKSMLGSLRDYNLIQENCHHFSSNCLTGHSENYDLALSLLKQTAYKTMGADTWRVWDVS